MTFLENQIMHDVDIHHICIFLNHYLSLTLTKLIIIIYATQKQQTTCVEVATVDSVLARQSYDPGRDDPEGRYQQELSPFCQIVSLEIQKLSGRHIHLKWENDNQGYFRHCLASHRPEEEQKPVWQSLRRLPWDYWQTLIQAKKQTHHSEMEWLQRRNWEVQEAEDSREGPYRQKVRILRFFTDKFTTALWQSPFLPKPWGEWLWARVLRYYLWQARPDCLQSASCQIQRYDAVSSQLPTKLRASQDSDPWKSDKDHQ